MPSRPWILEHDAGSRSRRRVICRAAVPARALPARTRRSTRPASRCAWGACIALALASCGGETAYVPRTPHVLALAMKRGQPALYREGALIDIGDAPAAAALHGCPPAVVSALDETADHQASAWRNNILGILSEGLSAIEPPLLAVSGVFFLLSLHHQEARNASLVDAINRHNDAPECRP